MWHCHTARSRWKCPRARLRMFHRFPEKIPDHLAEADPLRYACTALKVHWLSNVLYSLLRNESGNSWHNRSSRIHSDYSLPTHKVFPDTFSPHLLVRQPYHWRFPAKRSQQYLYPQNYLRGDLAAAAVLSGLPITIVFLLAQRWLVGGLTAGGVKG